MHAFYLFNELVLAESSVPMERLKNLCAQMTKTSNEFRRCLSEVKEIHTRQIDRVQRERDAALLAARVHADVDDANNINQMQGVEIANTKKVKSGSISDILLCFLCEYQSVHY